jgi:peptidoglycan hydrolase-like protein with peptidoglycan-binding domain
MSQDSNQWLKIAGLLNESADPSENILTEVKEEAQAPLAESSVRQIVRKQIKRILSERTARKDDISQLQGVLNNLLGDDTVSTDGIIGPETANAIAQFQRNAGLEADGVVGPKTYAAMTSALNAMDMSGALSDLPTDVPVIGRSGLVDLAPEPALDRDIEFSPGSNLVVGDDASDKAVADALAMLTGDASLASKVGIQPEDRAAVAAAIAQGDVKVAAVNPEGLEVKTGTREDGSPIMLNIRSKSGVQLDVGEPEQLATGFMSGDLLVDVN